MHGDDTRRDVHVRARERRRAALRLLKRAHPSERKLAQRLLFSTVRMSCALAVVRALHDTMPPARKPLLACALRAYLDARDFRIVLHLLKICPRSPALDAAFQDFMEDIVATLEGQTFWADLRLCCPRSVASAWDAWDMRP